MSNVTPSKKLEGKRIRLVRCNDANTQLPPGLTGTINLVDDLGTVHVKWDNGETLGMCWNDGDRWTIIPV